MVPGKSDRSDIYEPVCNNITGYNDLSVDRVLALQYHMLHKILVTTIRSIVTVTFVWLFHVALSRKWLLNMAVVLYIANALIGIYSSIASDLLLLYLPKSSSPSVAGLDAAQSCPKKSAQAQERTYTTWRQKSISRLTHLHFTFVLVSVTFRGSFAVFLMVATFFPKTQLTFLH